MWLLPVLNAPPPVCRMPACADRLALYSRYLLLNFPQLAEPHTHILELGCGCGSSLLPVLKANPTCRVTGSDISASAVAMLRRAAEQANIAPERVATHVCDGAATNEASVPGALAW